MQFRPIDEVIKENFTRYAMEEGLKRGMEKGIEQGMEQGMEKGKLQVVRSLLANGVPPDILVKSSGLSLNDIQGLSVQ